MRRSQKNVSANDEVSIETNFAIHGDIFHWKQTKQLFRISDNSKIVTSDFNAQGTAVENSVATCSQVHFVKFRLLRPNFYIILNGFEHLFRRLQGAAEVLLLFNLTTFERLPFFRGRIVSLPCRAPVAVASLFWFSSVWFQFALLSD